MRKLLSLFLLFMLPGMAEANVVILGTRVIYPAEQKSVSVQLNNGDATPSLIQAWIDTGDASAAPDSVKVPFIITPPVSRIEPRSGQTLRLMWTGEPLPEDRESLFWLNVLDIPPRPRFDDNYEGSRNYLQFAVRSRIKLFWRPSKLGIQPEDAYGRLVWHAGRDKSGDWLRVVNPTPFWITCAGATVSRQGTEVSVREAGMVAPFSEKRFPVTGRVSAGETVKWTVINDYGGRQSGDAVLK